MHALDGLKILVVEAYFSRRVDLSSGRVGGATMTEFSIKIPEVLRKKYKERPVRDTETLAEAFDAGRFDEFAKVGHKLKGNAVT